MGHHPEPIKPMSALENAIYWKDKHLLLVLLSNPYYRPTILVGFFSYTAHKGPCTDEIAELYSLAYGTAISSREVLVTNTTKEEIDCYIRHNVLSPCEVDCPIDLSVIPYLLELGFSATSHCKLSSMLRGDDPQYAYTINVDGPTLFFMLCKLNSTKLIITYYNMEAFTIEEIVWCVDMQLSLGQHTCLKHLYFVIRWVLRQLNYGLITLLIVPCQPMIGFY
jgi:hypothetical protein